MSSLKIELIGRGKIFYKLEKTNGQTGWPTRIKMVALFYLIHGLFYLIHGLQFFCSFYYALGISSPKIKSLR